MQGKQYHHQMKPTVSNRNVYKSRNLHHLHQSHQDILCFIWFRSVRMFFVKHNLTNFRWLSFQLSKLYKILRFQRNSSDKKRLEQTAIVTGILQVIIPHLYSLYLILTDGFWLELRDSSYKKKLHIKLKDSYNLDVASWMMDIHIMVFCAACTSPYIFLKDKSHLNGLKSPICFFYIWHFTWSPIHISVSWNIHTI